MEVSPESSNATPEGLILSSSKLHIIQPEGHRFHVLTKLSHEGLSVSSGDISQKYHFREA